MAARDSKLELLRVVVLPPGDVAEERDLVGLVVDDLNRRVAPEHGCQLSVWRVSIAAASASAPLAGAALALAAHLGPDAIPRSLFTVIIDCEKAIERKWLADAVSALARLSLAAVDKKTVSVHRLLQKVVRDDVLRSESRFTRRG